MNRQRLQWFPAFMLFLLMVSWHPCQATVPEQAANPIPETTSITPTPEVVLQWTAGAGAASHNVYFGTDLAEVSRVSPRLAGDADGNGYVGMNDLHILMNGWLADCSEANAWCEGADIDENEIVDLLDVGALADNWSQQCDNTTFQGNQVATTFDPGELQARQTYYWRIDEVNGPDVGTGEVWEFSTWDGTNNDPGLVMWFDFDEASLGTMPNNTVFSDRSENVWTATLKPLAGRTENAAEGVSGAPGAIQQGDVNRAIDFNADSTLSVPPSAFSTVADNDEVTIAMWAYADSTNWMCPFGVGGAVTRIYIPISPSAIRFMCGGWDDWVYAIVTDVSEFSGGWSHWAFTKNSSTGHIKVYRNGVLKIDESGMLAMIPAATVMNIGSLEGGYPQYYPYDGKLDDVRMYDKEYPLSGIERLAGIADLRKSWWPTPGDWDTDLPSYTAIDLSWAAGEYAVAHDVYLGTSSEAVDSATTSSTEYKGRQQELSYTTEILNAGSVYYWRIDEVAVNNQVTKGDTWAFVTANDVSVTVENDHVRYVIGGDGSNLEFSQKSGSDYLDTSTASKFAKLKLDDVWYEPTAITDYSSNQMTVRFEEPDVTVVIDVDTYPNYLTFSVNSVSNGDVQELVFLDIPLTNQGTTDDAFPACAMVMNYHTRVEEVPGSNSRLTASSLQETGIADGKAAIVAAPKVDFRNALKDAVASIGDVNELATSVRGGPWAMDDRSNYDSFIFSYNNLSTSTVNDFVTMCNDLSIKQVDVLGHTIISNNQIAFRYGDYALNPAVYPNGKADLTSVINTLHAAGIQASLHNFSFFVSKNSSHVTPVPNHDLAYDAEFTLAGDISSTTTTIPVIEDTSAMHSVVTGSSSITLRIDDELITYAGVDKSGPDYAFTVCTRGAFGTTRANHSANAKVYNLKEYYNCFLPAPDTALWGGVARCIADLYNDCNFDMLYMDALDGSVPLSGDMEWRHYYAGQFCQEVFKRLNSVPYFETSTRNNHYIWFLRSRLGATDFSSRGYKTVADIHVEENLANERIFMPSHLGWWGVRFGLNNQIEPTFSDITAYICAKAIAYDSSLSFQNITPANYDSTAYMQKTMDLFHTYETLRLSDYFSETIKDRFKVAGDEFVIEPDGGGGWDVYAAAYDRHKVEDIDGLTNVWTVDNVLGAQPLKVRIEVLQSPDGYENANNKVLAGFGDPETEFPVEDRLISSVVDDVDLTSSSSVVYPGGTTNSGCFTARNTSASSRRGTYAKLARSLSAPLSNLYFHQALGVWIYGDGKGEILNFQFPPEGIGSGRMEHYATIDFTGWRYFEFIESDVDEVGDYLWPYSSHYYKYIYSWSVDYSDVDEFDIWYNNLPPNDTATCYISPVKAIRTNTVSLSNCSLTINGDTITFPAAIHSGMFLEFYSTGNCKLYNADGSLNTTVTATGTVPTLMADSNTITFDCINSAGLRSRAYVTVISQSDTALE